MASFWGYSEEQAKQFLLTRSIVVKRYLRAKPATGKSLPVIVLTEYKRRNY